jgi:arsenate reductase
VTGPEDAMALMREYPPIIKRPILSSGTALLVGFDPEAYADTLLGRSK